MFLDQLSTNGMTFSYTSYLNGSVDEMPTFKDLVEFVEKRSRSMQVLEVIVNAIKKKSVASNANTNVRSRSSFHANTSDACVECK